MQKNHRGMCADALSLIINFVLSPLNLIVCLTRIWKIINKCISEVILRSRNILESLNGKRGYQSVQFNCSVVSDSLWPPGLQHTRLPCPSPTPEFTQTHVHWVGDAIQPSHSLLSPSPPAFNLSQHQGLSYESVLPIRWPKYWSFSFSISPSKEYSGLISFRMDCLDLLAVQGTLKSLIQHQFKNINSSVLSFLYSPSLTSRHDYWKNYSLD